MAQIEQLISSFVRKYIPQWYFPDVHLTDVLEVIILTFLIYQLLRWIKNTKAWMLLKGILVLAVFIFLAALFRMNTILFLARNSITVLATAAIVVFQPELRRALEKLGEKNFIPVVGAAEKTRAKEQEKIVDDIVDASFEMGKVKTGALIVIEGNTKLTEYEATGIPLDCLVSREVLINIFEHNTPLHDGAIIIRGNRITAATCYLPLSDNGALSKELGTRHRAGLALASLVLQDRLS